MKNFIIRIFDYVCIYAWILESLAVVLDGL